MSWGKTHADQNVDSDQWRIGGTEVRDVVEDMIRRVWQEVEGVDLPQRFQVMTYRDAMARVSILFFFWYNSPPVPK